MKRIVGIIFEANPFHYGHQYLIKEVKKALEPDLLIGITSGYFSMRGEVSLLSKKQKTQILLDQGIDLVVELPIFDTLNSANKFASSSIKYLARLGITDLCFGVENGKLEFFQRVLEIEETSAFQNLFKEKLNANLSYKTSYLQAIGELLPNSDKLLASANATLALEYLRTLKDYPIITPHLIKRIGNSEESTSLEGLASGTAIRESYYQGHDISHYIPYDTNMLSDISTLQQNMHTLILSMLANKSYANKKIPLVREGIEHYIENNYQMGLSYLDNLNHLANKKYSKSRIRRTILSLLLELDAQSDKDYTRILGFSETGLSYLRQTNLNNAIININSENKLLLKNELKCVSLYSILLNKDYTIEEYQFPLKRKDTAWKN